MSSSYILSLAISLVLLFLLFVFFFFFFFNDTATPEIYTLSLHDALPIFPRRLYRARPDRVVERCAEQSDNRRDRKSTRLNSSHLGISYAVFCLKKKKKKKTNDNKL